LDDDMDQDQGLNLGAALANNQFHSKNIFEGQKGAMKQRQEEEDENLNPAQPR